MGRPPTHRAPHGADFLQLDPSAAPARGLTTWLAGALRAGIRDGRLQRGTALPATRVLADDLGVSRGVIVEAYQRLRDEGLISARPGAGTRVLPCGAPVTVLAGTVLAGTVRAGTVRAGTVRAGTAPPGTPHGEPGPGGPASRVLSLPRRWRAHTEIDLSPGVPDLSAFPRAAWLRAERAVLAQATAADLGYGDPRGSEQLRTRLADWLARTRGLRTSADTIIVVAGVAQALALLAQALRARGEIRIAVEDPGSRGAREELVHWGLDPVPVPVDDVGLRVADLVRSGVPAAVLTPAHQFPTGVVLGPERRRDLLNWAAAGGLVIEDDYDAEFRYDRAPVPALHASAPGRIAYAGSVSKTLAPGMRLGWLVPPPWLHADIVAAKHASDLGTPALPQLVLAHMIAAGDLEHHIRLVRNRQRRRRDALLAGLREHLPRARIQGIPAGLHLLVTFPGLAGRLDDTDLARRMQQSGVLAHALSWHRERPGPPGLVLGYAAHTPDEVREAARRIARTVHDLSP